MRTLILSILLLLAACNAHSQTLYDAYLNKQIILINKNKELSSTKPHINNTIEVHYFEVDKSISKAININTAIVQKAEKILNDDIAFTQAYDNAKVRLNNYITEWYNEQRYYNNVETKNAEVILTNIYVTPIAFNNNTILCKAIRGTTLSTPIIM
jgi:hypothetical protein